MLTVVNGRAVADFTGSEQVRVSTSGDRPGLHAEHRPQADASDPEVTPRHAHDPVDAPELVCATISALVQELDEEVAVAHPLPWTLLSMDAVHRSRIGKPCRARRVARRKHRHLVLHVLVLWLPDLKRRRRRRLVLLVLIRLRLCADW